MLLTAKFIILNIKFLVFDTKFLVFNAKFITFTHARYSILTIGTLAHDAANRNDVIVSE